MSPLLALFGRDRRVGECLLLREERKSGLRGAISVLGGKADFAATSIRQEAQRKIDRRRVARRTMQKPPLDPDVADTAPSNSVLTVYDEEHIITYLRLLDAVRWGADWREVARIVLHIDPQHEPDRARRAFDSHLSRAKWITEEHGYRLLLRGGASA
jgi:hypothetical protein